jgi:hypothetical protein
MRPFSLSIIQLPHAERSRSDQSTHAPPQHLAQRFSKPTAA